MNGLGEGVLRHVACKVTVDGTPADASPVEVPLIQIGNLTQTLEHAGTREGQSFSRTVE